MPQPARPALPPHVRVVDSLEALLGARFAGDGNAIVWERRLAGDFAEVVELLETGDGITQVDEAALEALRPSAAGAQAIATLLADLRGLRGAGHLPELNVVGRYERDDDDVLPTDVHSFHVDSANVPTDTFLCCYSGAPSEVLANRDAVRAVDLPHVRAALLARYGGADDEGFAAWLREHHFDLHHRPLPHARPFSLGVGHLWRLAVQFPGGPVAACIHRAPPPGTDRAPRLLLIS